MTGIGKSSSFQDKVAHPCKGGATLSAQSIFFRLDDIDNEFDRRIQQGITQMQERTAQVMQRMSQVDREFQQRLKRRIAQMNTELSSRMRGLDMPDISPYLDLPESFSERDGLDLASRLVRGFGTDKASADPQKVEAMLREIQEIIKGGDVFWGLLKKNYIYLEKSRTVFKFSPPREIEKLEQIYRENWKDTDPEWVEYLVEKFRESLKGSNQFAILRFNKSGGYVGMFDPDDIIGFLRYTPHDDGNGWMSRAVYLGAVNIAVGFQGYSLLRYMFEESAIMQFVTKDTIYLDTVPDSPAEKVWRAMGFEPVPPGRPVDIRYGKNKQKVQRLLPMLLTKEKFESLKKSKS